MPRAKHPMQPVYFDRQRIIRFKPNKIVQYMLDAGRDAKLFDLNKFALLPFDREDHVQLAQLIGYSVCGFGDLSYVPRATVAAADRAAERLERSRRRKRRKR